VQGNAASKERSKKDFQQKNTQDGKSINNSFDFIYKKIKEKNKFFFDDKNELKIRFLSSDDTTLMNKISDFSNCLIVVDEAHHLNSSQDEFNDDDDGEKPIKNMKLVPEFQ
jgi:superfamily II DNA or RNA helicase